DAEARAFLVAHAQGDARVALNALELAARLARTRRTHTVDVPLLEEAAQQRALRYDKAGEEHYNVISAFIKSLRGSDPDAAVYWMMRMLEAGEDPLFIARRMVIFAAEDVGNAEPQALQVAVAAKDAVHFVGLPEGRIPLAQAATFLATCPKSNAAYQAMLRASEDVRASRAPPPRACRRGSGPCASRTRSPRCGRRGAARPRAVWSRARDGPSSAAARGRRRGRPQSRARRRGGPGLLPWPGGRAPPARARRAGARRATPPAHSRCGTRRRGSGRAAAGRRCRRRRRCPGPRRRQA